MQKCLNKFVFIFGFIIVIFCSCLNKSVDNKNKTLTMVKVQKDTSRLINKSNYNKFIGKSGNIKVVEINVDFYSSIKYRQELYNQKIKFDAIEIPFHCTPIILTDSIAILTNPMTFNSEITALVVVNYKHGVFNFSGGGDDIDLFVLKRKDKVSIHAALAKDKILYEIQNSPLTIKKIMSNINDSGQLYFDYKDVIDKRIKVIEKHQIRIRENVKYRIENFIGKCD